MNGLPFLILCLELLRVADERVVFEKEDLCCFESMLFEILDALGIWVSKRLLSLLISYCLGVVFLPLDHHL